MIDLTAIILTKNEELNIVDCINSIKDLAKRIIVIDSFSADRTVEIAEGLGAEVRKHEFINYSKQFLYGLNETDIRTAWVLRIDADERFLSMDRAIESTTKVLCILRSPSSLACFTSGALVLMIPSACVFFLMNSTATSFVFSPAIKSTWTTAVLSFFLIRSTS